VFQFKTGSIGNLSSFFVSIFLASFFCGRHNFSPQTELSDGPMKLLLEEPANYPPAPPRFCLVCALRLGPGSFVWRYFPSLCFLPRPQTHGFISPASCDVRPDPDVSPVLSPPTPPFFLMYSVPRCGCYFSAPQLPLTWVYLQQMSVSRFGWWTVEYPPFHSAFKHAPRFLTQFA